MTVRHRATMHQFLLLCIITSIRNIKFYKLQAVRALVMGDGVPCYGALEIVGLLLLLLVRPIYNITSTKMDCQLNNKEFLTVVSYLM